jgi:hypothetical protein
MKERDLGRKIVYSSVPGEIVWATRVKMLIAISVVVLLGIFSLCLVSIRIFGPSTGLNCSSRRLTTVPIDESGSVLTVNDEICDDGLNVGGAYVVSLEAVKEARQEHVELLRQSNMPSAARVPAVKLLSPGLLQVTGQKSLTVRTGPHKMGRITVKYVLE